MTAFLITMLVLYIVGAALGAFSLVVSDNPKDIGANALKLIFGIAMVAWASFLLWGK